MPIGLFLQYLQYCYERGFEVMPYVVAISTDLCMLPCGTSSLLFCRDKRYQVVTNPRKFLKRHIMKTLYYWLVNELHYLNCIKKKKNNPFCWFGLQYSVLIMCISCFLTLTCYASILALHNKVSPKAIGIVTITSRLTLMHLVCKLSYYWIETDPVLILH